MFDVSQIPLVYDAFPVNRAYVDGFLDQVHIVSDTFTVTYFRVVTLGADLVRVPWLEVRRPLSTFVPGHFDMLLLEQRAKIATTRKLILGESPPH